MRRAPPQHRYGARPRASGGIWEDPAGAREYPTCAEGWAMWVPGGSPDLTESHRGYPPVGEAVRGRTSWQGLLLGRLGGVFGALWRPRSRLPTALWGIQKGKADVAARRARRQAGRAAARPRSPQRPADPVTRELFRPETRAVGRSPAHDSYLVDSASSHMLVSKIKPCMSKYKQLYSETANGSLNQLSFI